MSFLIKSEMKKDVVVIDRDEPVIEAAKILARRRIGCLVVVGEGKPVGVMTERDILNHAVVPEKNLKETRVKEIMTKTPITLNPENTIEEASHLFNTKKIKKLPITEKGKLVGILTQTDLLNAMERIESEQSRVVRRNLERAHKTKLKLLKKIRNLELEISKLC